MWIINIPGYYLPTAFHPDPGPNSVLIQIADPLEGGWSLAEQQASFPVPKFPFPKSYQFRFLDMTDDNLERMDSESQEHFKSGLITDEQASDIADILMRAYEKQSNVVVHCSAGICRSGAVCEVGVMMGFEDIKNNRIPNLLVKRKLIEQLMKKGFF